MCGARRAHVQASHQAPLLDRSSCLYSTDYAAWLRDAVLKRLQGLGFRVQGLGFKSVLRVRGLGFRVG